MYRASQVAWTIRVASPLRQIYSSLWNPGLRIYTSVHSSAPIAHGSANLFCNRLWQPESPQDLQETGPRCLLWQQLAPTTVANLVVTVLWWIPISSPTPVWKPGSPTCRKKHLHPLPIKAPPLISVFSRKKYSNIHATFSSWNLTKDDKYP